MVPGEVGEFGGSDVRGRAIGFDVAAYRARMADRVTEGGTAHGRCARRGRRRQQGDPGVPVRLRGNVDPVVRRTDHAERRQARGSDGVMAKRTKPEPDRTFGQHLIDEKYNRAVRLQCKVRDILEYPVTMDDAFDIAREILDSLDWSESTVPSDYRRKLTRAAEQREATRRAE